MEKIPEFHIQPSHQPLFPILGEISDGEDGILPVIEPLVFDEGFGPDEFPESRVDVLDPDLFGIDSDALVGQDPGIVFVRMPSIRPNPVPVIGLVPKEREIGALAMGVIAEIGEPIPPP